MQLVTKFSFRVPPLVQSQLNLLLLDDNPFDGADEDVLSYIADSAKWSMSIGQTLLDSSFKGLDLHDSRV